MPERQAAPPRRLRIGAMTMSRHSASGPPDLAWTGERYLPVIGGPIGLEHLHRYLLAAELANGKVVVDIACGEGYGSAMLAVSAARVYGVDIASEAVDFARHKYARSTLEFLLGSCTAIPLPDASVDLVVSFETLEHHAQHDEMMQEVRRILRPDGVLIISSPDKHEYTEVLGNANTYHLKELYREEFECLLQRHFSHTRLFGQRMVFGSNIALIDTAPAPCDYVTFSGDMAASARTAGIERPVYFVAMASDQALPALPNSFFQGAYGDLQAKEERLAHLGVALKEKDGRLATLARSVADHVDRIAALQHGVGERDARIARLEHAVFEGEEKSKRFARELATQEAKLAGVLASNSWLMTNPLRWLRRSLLTRPLWLARQALADPMRRAWLGLPHAADRGRQLIAAVHGRFALAIGGRRDRPAPHLAATGVAHARQCMPDAQTSSATPLPAAESATAARRVVVVAHDAHPHGAQYLALGIARELSRSFACEVEVVCLGGGQLKAGFAEYATLHDLENIDPRGQQACELAAALYQRGFRHAIVNTTVAGHFLATLKLAGLHCVALIHEMRGVILAHHLQPHALCIANHADRVVFSAPAVRHDFNTFAPIDQHRTILRPQGLYKRNPWAARGARAARQALRGELELPPAAKIESHKPA